jgi:hypothetical protein
MPVTYTNRKGQTYVLCQGTTKTGKRRYYFARELKGEALHAIPSGYQIEESVNGVVSLVKDRPQLVRPEELAAVEGALKRHPQSGKYRLQIKENQILVYERQGPDIEALNAMFGRLSPLPPRGVESLQQSGHYIPIMRFVLLDRISGHSPPSGGILAAASTIGSTRAARVRSRPRRAR